MSRPPRKSRNVRVEDELWDAAQKAADEQGHVLSEQIRFFLARYVKAHAKRPGPTDVPPPRRPVCDCGKFHDARDEQRT